MRSWIEDSFKDLKSDGWQWQNTRMSDPDRAARLWLALAVATLWVVSVGGELDAKLHDCDLSQLPLTHIARKTKIHSFQARKISCFARGIINVLTTLINRHPISLGILIPEPWPLKTYP